jgi:cysteine desulfurase / selenocysteine lyase
LLTDDSRRVDFPILGDMTYLNTAAEGIPPRAVEAAVVQYTVDKRLGMDGRDRHFAQLQAARREAATAYGLRPEEVSICSCSSEAFNLAASALRIGAGYEVIVNDLDFPAGCTPWLHPGCRANVRIWRARQGALRIDDLVRLLGPRTRLVTTSLVSFYNGFMVPLGEVVQVVQKHSPALLAVDVTQALGRIPLDLSGVDLIVSSTHKWILASHGGCLVGVPARRADEWTVPAGGWFNLQDPFGPDRFERVTNQRGAPSFSVGMPNFPAVYAIHAALRYIRSVGVEAIDRHARPLVAACLEGLRKLPVEMLTPHEPGALAGILAFRHPAAERIHRFLHDQNIHVMSHAGRLRVAIHGYNTMGDIERFLRATEEATRTA